jgi:hypothetical protein
MRGRIASTVVLLLSVVLILVFPISPVHHNLPGFTSTVVSFELVTTPEQILDILGRPEDPARESTVAAMDRGNWLDFLYLLAYPALQVAIAAQLVARGLAPRGLLWGVSGLAVAMGLCDALENVQLLTLSALTEPSAMERALPALYLSARAKWTALFVISALLAPFVWRAPGAWRYSALLFGGGAAVGALAVVWLPGVEYGGYLVGLAWLWTWGHSLRSRA